MYAYVRPIDPMGIHIWMTGISSFEQLADYAQRTFSADQEHQELILAFLYSQVGKTCWHILAELQCC